MRHFKILILFIFYLTFDINAQCPDVSNITCTTLSPTAIELSWTGPQPGGIIDPEGYHVFYRKVGGSGILSSGTQHQDPWINEVKYRGTAGSKGFEIIGPDETSLDCYKVQLFRANGNRTAGNFGIRDLSGTFVQINANNNFFEAIWDQEAFDNGGGYIALYYEGNDCDCPREDKLIEFLSYGQPNSPPDVMNSTVNPILHNATIFYIGETIFQFNSISLTDIDAGDTPNDYTWQEQTPSPDDLNPGQLVYPKLYGSNDKIVIENLEPCTEYEFFVRSDCGGLLVGNNLPAPNTCTTDNTVKTANFKDPGGTTITNLNICEGTNPNFMADATFDHISPNNTCPILTTYFLTTPGGVIVSNFSSVADLNTFMTTAPNNPYLIQAIGHHGNLTGTGSGKDISLVGSDDCFRLTTTPIDFKVFNIPTIVSLAPANPSVCSGGDGSITVSVSGFNSNLGPLSYRIQGAPSWQSSPIFPNLSAGSYTILVQYDAAIGNITPNNCFTSQTVVLTDPGGPVVASSSNPVSCNGGNDGSIDLNPPAGANYSYQWSNGPMTQNVNNLMAGSYSVVITDNATSCQSVITGIMVSEPAPISVSITLVTPPGCFGGNDGSATANPSGGTPGYTFEWSSGEISSIANALSSGSNSVTITDANGCEKIETFTVGSPTQVTVFASEDAQVVCNGEANGQATITINGGTPPYNYLWDNNEMTQTAFSLDAGLHTYIVTDDNGCVITGSVNINEPPVLSASTQGITNVSCNGESDGSATITATGGNGNYSYQWGNGETSATANALANGNTSYTVTDNKGCTFIGSVAITQPVILSATAVITSDVTCNGFLDGVGTITPNGGTMPYNYIWGSTVGGSTSTNLPAGTTIFTVLDANGCSTTGTVFVNQPTALNATIINVLDVKCYNSKDGEAEADPTGGTPPYTFLWDSGETNAIAVLLSPGTHAVTITDDNGCILVEDNIQIGNAQVFTASTTTQDALCFGYTDGEATATPTGGAPGAKSYQWDAAAGGQTNALAVGLGAGTYTVSVTDSNGCVTTASALVEEPDEVTISFPSFNATTCLGLEETITAAAIGGAGALPSDYSYEWSTGTLGDATTVTVNSSTVAFSVSATDINGCEGVSSSTITGLAPPVISPIDPVTISEDDQFMIDLDQYVTNDSISYNYDLNFLSDCDALNQNSGQTPDELTETFSVTNQNSTGVAIYTIIPVYELPSGQQCYGDSVTMEVIVLPGGETATFFVPDVFIKGIDTAWDIRVSDTDNSASSFNVQVFNRSGAKVHDGTLADPWTADNVQDGTYYYVISDGSSKIKTGAVLVQQ